MNNILKSDWLPAGPIWAFTGQLNISCLCYWTLPSLLTVQYITVQYMYLSFIRNVTGQLDYFSHGSRKQTQMLSCTTCIDQKGKFSCFSSSYSWLNLPFWSIHVHVNAGQHLSSGITEELQTKLYDTKSCFNNWNTTLCHPA